jgi:hypothetical protein
VAVAAVSVWVAGSLVALHDTASWTAWGAFMVGLVGIVFVMMWWEELA